MKSVFVKHLFFIVVTFLLSYITYYFISDKIQGQFILSGWAFLSVFTTLLIIGSLLLFSNSVKNNTMALLVALILKFLATATYLLIYISQVTAINIVGVLGFMILYFIFTPWMLYLLLNYFKANEIKKSTGEISTD